MKSPFKPIRTFLLAAAVAMAGLASMPAQATSLTDFLENKLIDWLLRGQSYTPPATVYISLHTSACSDTSTGTEVSGGSYARVAVTSSLANWAGTQAAASTSASSGTGGTTSNNAAISFPTPSASWGTVTHFGIFDASTSGNMLVCQALTASKTINSGDTVSFAAAALTFQIDN